MEPYKQFPAVATSPCLCLNPRNFLEDFPLSSYADCPSCLRAASAYSLRFSPGYLPDCLAHYSGDYVEHTTNKCQHLDRWFRHFDGCSRVTGGDRRISPSGACKMHAYPAHLASLGDQCSELCYRKSVAPKCVDSAPSSPVCSMEIFASGDNKGTPLKISAAESIQTNLASEKTQTEPDLEDPSKLDDILAWKRKHLDQLRMQQTEVSENNITDELKDIKTSSAVVPAEFTPPTTPLRADRKPGEVHEKSLLEKSSGLEASAKSFEMLKVELRRQELKVKLYESMLRRQRNSLSALQSTLQDQKDSYEEQIASLKTELFRLREKQKVKAMQPDRTAADFLNKEVQTEAGPYQSHSESGPNRAATSARVSSDIQKGERQHPEDQTISDVANDTSEARLVELRRQIDAEELALNFMRDDLTNKDQHLKTLRTTLRELSNCNSELLEKNIELESLLHRKQNRPVGGGGGVNEDAVENRLLKEVDRCILELQCIADALLALFNGFDPLPLLLLSGHENDAKGSGCRTAESRIGKVLEMQSTIDRLRELIIQRVLTSHYRLPAHLNPS